MRELKWKRCAKDIYVDLTIHNIGTTPAVSKFNAAMVRVLRVLVNLGIAMVVILSIILIKEASYKHTQNIWEKL